MYAEPRCSHIAKLAISSSDGSTGSGEPETIAAGDNRAIPLHPVNTPAVTPITPVRAVPIIPPDSRPSWPEEASPASKLAPRVLVAEDNLDMQQIFARQLNLLGLEVVGVGNGRDAVSLVLAAYDAGNPFDLVLMDLEMPIVDGYEATRRIRAGGFQGPILALSAHSSDDYQMDSIRMGCNDCVCKPIDWIQLAGLIRRYVPGCNDPGPILIPDD